VRSTRGMETDANDELRVVHGAKSWFDIHAISGVTDDIDRLWLERQYSEHLKDTVAGALSAVLGIGYPRDGPDSEGVLGPPSIVAGGSERLDPDLGKGSLFWTKTPVTLNEIMGTVEKLQRGTNASKEMLLFGCMYCDLLKQIDVKYTLTPHTAKRLFVTSAMMASKYYDACPSDNTVYADICGINLAKMNKMEVAFLEIISYQFEMPIAAFIDYRRQAARGAIARDRIPSQYIIEQPASVSEAAQVALQDAISNATGAAGAQQRRCC